MRHFAVTSRSRSFACGKEGAWLGRLRHLFARRRRSRAAPTCTTCLLHFGTASSVWGALTRTACKREDSAEPDEFPHPTRTMAATQGPDALSNHRTDLRTRQGAKLGAEFRFGCQERKQKAPL